MAFGGRRSNKRGLYKVSVLSRELDQSLRYDRIGLIDGYILGRSSVLGGIFRQFGPVVRLGSWHASVSGSRRAISIAVAAKFVCLSTSASV
jgi:hypothetical protein